MPDTPAAADDAGRPRCPTARYYSTVPSDLITWTQASAELERSPRPMTRQDVRRRYRQTGRRVWRRPGVRGELVSRSDLLQWHRDLVRGWLTAAA